MIFIVISIDVRPEGRDEFLDGITRYSAQVRAEPGSRLPLHRIWFLSLIGSVSNAFTS